MKLAEFKAWFEGFTENVGGAPTEAQWGRIKEQVAKIDGTATTQTAFVARYVRGPHYPSPYLSYLAQNMCVGNVQGTTLKGVSVSQPETWNAQQAFRDLGRAEAQGVA